jgi:hypothetical protein
MYAPGTYHWQVAAYITVYEPYNELLVEVTCEADTLYNLPLETQFAYLESEPVIRQRKSRRRGLKKLICEGRSL